VRIINKKNILKHSTVFDNVDQEILPAKTFVPDWYKNSKKWNVDSINTNNEKDIKSIPLDEGFKLCVPFLESLVSVYMIPLAQDIAIKQTEGGPSITYNQKAGIPIQVRDQRLNDLFPIPLGTSNVHFSWQTSIAFKIPKGYSALLTHPLNRFDLPFITTSGIIDGEYSVPPGNVPVFISSTFEGIIPMGTPIIQILLFKTEKWSSINDKNIINEALNNNKKAISVTHGWYKKNIWNKKSYN
jgi:hypothetical protein